MPIATAFDPRQPRPLYLPTRPRLRRPSHGRGPPWSVISTSTACNASQLRDKTPELRENTPEPREKTLKPREKTPELRDKTPELRDKTPELRDKTPELRDKTIELRDKTIELRDKTPRAARQDTEPTAKIRAPAMRFGVLLARYAAGL